MNPVNETAEFASRVNLENGQAIYLHDAVRFFMAAKSAVSYEQRFCDIDNPEAIAIHLMLASMAAKYQPDLSVSGMVASLDELAQCTDNKLDELVAAIQECAEGNQSNVRDLTEAVRTIADQCQGIGNSIEALRRMVDTYGDAFYKQAATQGRGR